MKYLFHFLLGLSAMLLCSCGYHLGGLKPVRMEKMNTFCVDVFENNTLQPQAGMLMTTAMANALQSDGTYKLAPRSEADFVVTGVVSHIDKTSTMTSTEDTYISKQLTITARVRYKVLDRKTGKVITSSFEEEKASYFNTIGNTQNAYEIALSYALRRTADEIVLTLTTR